MTYESSQIEPYLNERTKTHTHTQIDHNTSHPSH